MLQRKDVDGFYGTLLETHFATIITANKPQLDDILFDPDLRRKIPWAVNIGGKVVSHYEPKDGQTTKHPIIQIGDEHGKILKIALKISDEELTAAGGMQIVAERSYVPESTASLLKSAHLTMFRLFGYSYALGYDGSMLAEILRTFYLTNRARTRQGQADAAKEYFPQHAGMIIPIGTHDENLLRGTIEDRRFIRCVGSSGGWFALGVVIRAGQLLHIVLLPPDRAEHMDTYFGFIKSIEKNEFVFQFMDFIPGDATSGAHWTLYKKEYRFQPELRGVA
ncbi:MAG TPA: hypothetical protein VJ521_05305 [Acidobacteriota bacterium]|nr:hypothetical protein [Acidobacteriota bacterium]